MQIASAKKHEWLSQEIRKEILERKLPAGFKLPTNAALMEKYGMSQATVVHAMKKLEREGYIRRRVGSGTFVQNRVEAGEIAIVEQQAYLKPESAPIWHMTMSRILDVINERNPKWRPKIHMLTSGRRGEPPIECDLLNADVVSNLRGVFSMASLPQIAEELEIREIPLLYLASTSKPHHPNQVFFDIEDLYRQAFNHLAQVGCKTVGVLCVEPGTPGVVTRPYLKFLDAIHGSGLTCRPEWMVYGFGPATEKAGWELFHRLWKQKDHPDALFVDDDMNFRGVMRASLELGVRFPEDIRVVTITPRGAPIPYHKPVTVVELDPGLLVNAGMDLMERLIRREEPENRHILVPVQLVKGETT